MMDYKTYREQRQAEFNALPIFFAFSNEQLEEEMNKRGPTLDDTDKICRAIGGFALKSDLPIIKEFVNKPDPLDELMKDPEFAYSAFYYEMANHEYHINNYQGNWDVLSCFGNIEDNEMDDYNDYFAQLDFDEATRDAYRRAIRDFLTDADKNGWY